MPEVDGSWWLPSRARETWPGIPRVAAPLLGAAAAVSLLLPPHTHEAKANELALYYGFTGWWVSGLLLSRRLTRKAWALLSVAAFGLLLPRFLGESPPDIGPSNTPPWLAYPVSVRWTQLVVASGVGLAALLCTRLILAIAERARSALLAAQLRRRPVFLYAASVVALALSGPGRVVSAIALFLPICYSAASAVTPACLRLGETRFGRLVVITVASVAGVMGGVASVLWGHLFSGPGGPFRSMGGLGFESAWISLVALAFAGIAVCGSELTIRCADRLGGLKTRLLAFGVLIVALIGGEPIELVQALVWPIEIQPSPIPGEARFSFSGTLPIIIVAWVAMSRRLSRDLGAARTRFRAIAAGELPGSAVVPSREESGRLLERIAHFSAQLGRRPFLEQLNAEIGARTERLEAATRRLNDTNAQRLEAERFAAISGIASVVGHELSAPVAQIVETLPLLSSSVKVTARCLRVPRDAGTGAPGFLAQTARQLSTSGRHVEESAHRAAFIVGDLNSLSATPLRALEEVDLRAMVERSVRLTPRNPSVHVNCDLESVPTLTARAGELEQVVVSLLEEAIGAVSSAGTVAVRLRVEELTILLEVEDDGSGLSRKMRSRGPVVEEPFLGLAIVSSIVRDHRGTLQVQSCEGGGTRFDVRLPLPD